MEAFAAYSLTIFLRRNFAAEKVKFALWNWRCSKKKRTLRPEIKKGVESSKGKKRKSKMDGFKGSDTAA